MRERTTKETSGEKPSSGWGDRSRGDRKKGRASAEGAEWGPA